MFNCILEIQLKKTKNTLLKMEIDEPYHDKKNPVFAICKQQRGRSACTSMQYDQHHCCLLMRWYRTYRFYFQNFKTLANFCNWACQFESYLVPNLRRQVFLWCGLDVDGNKWAASWQNQQNVFAPSEDSDQPGHPSSLIRVFAVCLMGS